MLLLHAGDLPVAKAEGIGVVKGDAGGSSDRDAGRGCGVGTFLRCRGRFGLRNGFYACFIRRLFRTADQGERHRAR